MAVVSPAAYSFGETGSEWQMQETGKVQLSTMGSTIQHLVVPLEVRLLIAQNSCTNQAVSQSVTKCHARCARVQANHSDMHQQLACRGLLIKH